MRKSNVILTLSTIFGAISTFVVAAWKAGRIVELVFSTMILFEVYYLIYNFRISELLPYVIPAGIYALYWLYLFSHKKVTRPKANLNWADTNWWWKLEGWEFEEEVAKVFILRGYKAEVTKKTGDDGADIIMYKDGKKIVVQCKHYSHPIPVAVARELNGIKEDFGADELIIIASSGATKACYDFIKNKPYFRILDLEDIIRMGIR